MAITANRDVLCCIFDQDGDPVEGATVTFTLSAFDRDGGCFVTIQDITGITDANGECTISVWPNSAGEDGSYYDVTAVDAGGVTVVNGQAYVMDVDNQQLTDLLAASVDVPLIVNRRNIVLYTGQDFEAEYTITNLLGS